jgi:single-strand DNA-binding protein
MSTVNKVILIGRLGKDPELKYTPAGVPVATFSLATSEIWKDKEGKKQEKVEWHRCVAWSHTAENINKYCKKGEQLYIEGRLETRSWDDKEGVKRYTTEIIVGQMQFMSSKSEGGAKPPTPTEPPASSGEGASTSTANTAVESHFTADEIPF